MNEKPNNGGPAFPAVDNWRVDSGMTLRDYFAAASISADTTGSPESRAKWAYEVADAMLEARK